MSKAPKPLVRRLRAALSMLRHARKSMHEMELWPDGTVLPEAQDYLDQYDAAIAAVREAIELHAGAGK